MKSLPVRILVAVITFIIGVGIASLWLTRWRLVPSINPVVTPAPAEVPAARLEMVFVLDTTGSMGGLIDGAKQRIWGIVNGVMQQSHASVRIGLVAYRDRGDDYVTQVLPLTEDLDKVYTRLMDYKAEGGGDTPEDVRTALADGVSKAGWSAAAPDLAQIMFLVGDAPPHDNYANTVDTLTTAANAVQKGIIVNTIQCGDMAETARAWRAIAQRGNGQYFVIAANGGVQAIATPYDEKLGDLANKLGATFISYGYGGEADAEAKRGAVATQAAAAEARVAVTAPSAAKAERAYNKVLSKDAYIGDLLQSIENGSVKLDSIKEADLPASLQAMSPAERLQEIEKRLAERRDIRAEITSLAKQRADFIATEQKKNGGEGSGFDVVVLQAVQKQMMRKKL
jgi:uncharacterized protein YegL